jgi:hypothetical protein
MQWQRCGSSIEAGHGRRRYLHFESLPRKVPGIRFFLCRRTPLSLTSEHKWTSQIVQIGQQGEAPHLVRNAAAVVSDAMASRRLVGSVSITKCPTFVTILHARRGGTYH